MIDPSRTVAELVLEQPSRSRVFEELERRTTAAAGQAQASPTPAGRRVGDPAAGPQAGRSAGIRAANEHVAGSPDWDAGAASRSATTSSQSHHEHLPRGELPPGSDTLLEKVVRGARRRAPRTGPSCSDVFTALRNEPRGAHHNRGGGATPALSSDHGGHPTTYQEQVAWRVRATTTSRPGRDARRSYASCRAATTLWTGRSATRTARRWTGLRELELDLHQHIHEENNVLFPARASRLHERPARESAGRDRPGSSPPTSPRPRGAPEGFPSGGVKGCRRPRGAPAIDGSLLHRRRRVGLPEAERVPRGVGALHEPAHRRDGHLVAGLAAELAHATAPSETSSTSK